MSITATERQMYIDRIQKRIKGVITVIETDHAAELRTIQADVRTTTLVKLDLTENVAEVLRLCEEKNAIDARLRTLRTCMSDKLTLDPSTYQWDTAFEDDLKRREDQALRSALASTDWGGRINTLRVEASNLIDTVMIATSPRELKELWGKFNGLLGLTPSPMEAAALAAADLQ